MNNMSEEVKFTYAWHLVKSQYKNDISKGIGLMSGACCLCVRVCVCVCACVCVRVRVRDHVWFVHV